MEFVVCCDLEWFKTYYPNTIKGREDRSNVGEHEGAGEMRYAREDPSHVILFKEGDQILGHAIWHQSNTDEHRKGSPRDEDDSSILRKLLGGKRDFVELHELWLGTELRGKG